MKRLRGGKQTDAEGDTRSELGERAEERKRKADARGHDAADIASRNIKRAEISSRR